MDTLERELDHILKEGWVRMGEPMRLHTSFRTGGPARAFVCVQGYDELAQILSFCRSGGIPLFVLGNGSNLLVSDAGYDGVVVTFGAGMDTVSCEGRCIRAGAGAHLRTAARLALEKGLTGMEFAAGIPGSVGGALVMNAGAYGSEIKDVLLEAALMDPDGTIRICPASQLGFSYRHSVIPEQRAIALWALFSLEEGDREAILKKMQELALKRRTRQPLEYPSAGSTFKRPAGYFAGKLIEEAGLKGFRIGDAQVSEKHAGFIINLGQASSAEIYSLCTFVKRRVFETSGVMLENEIKLLGEFPVE